MTEKEVYLGFKVTFLHHRGFMGIFKIGVFLLQFSVFPTSSSILKPHCNLSRVQTKFQCEPILLFRLKFVFIFKVLLQKTNLLSTELPLLDGSFSPVFSSFVLSVSPASWLCLPWTICIDMIWTDQFKEGCSISCYRYIYQY